MVTLVDGYLIYLHNKKQASENTFKSYKRDLIKMMDYLKNRNITDIKTVNSRILQEYLDYMITYGYAATTITRNFISMKSFFTYLCESGLMEENPAVGILLPKVEGNPNPILTKEEMQLLLNPPVVFSFKGLRDRAMLLVLYYTKISISELVKMKVSAVDFLQDKLVFEKGRHMVSFPMNADMKEALEAYINYKKLSATDWLFPNRYGNPMSRQGFWKTIKNYAKEIGIDKDITLYSIKQGEL